MQLYRCTCKQTVSVMITQQVFSLSLSPHLALPFLFYPCLFAPSSFFSLLFHAFSYEILLESLGDQCKLLTIWKELQMAFCA